MRVLATALILSVVATSAAAQTTHDGRGWVNLTAMGSVKDRLIYFAEVQTRTRDGADEYDQLLLRPAIGWKVSDTLSLYQGYARVISNPVRGRDTFEDRSFQQASWAPGKVGPLSVSLRFRLEQRWRQDGEDTGWRGRAMARFALPLQEDGKGAKLLGWAEPFVALNTTDWGARRGFDQLRSFAGLELPAGGKSTAEIGYLNQLVDRPAGARDMNHVVSITLFIRP